MPSGLSVALGGALAGFCFLVFVMAGTATLWLEQLRSAVRSWPAIGGPADSALGWLEDQVLGAARLVVQRSIDLLRFADSLTFPAIQDLAGALLRPLSEQINGLLGFANLVTTALTLNFLPPVEREIPTWFKHLDDELARLPDEPAFRAGGPLRLLLQWLSDVWAVAARLGPFIRLVALPVLFVLGLLWGLVETLGRITHLEVLVNGLLGFTDFLRREQLADEAAFAQLVLVVNGLLTHAQQLQVDLDQERAARVALATQTTQLVNAAVSRFQTQLGGVQGEVTPLLILGVLASLGASGLDVLRKTAQCDPCGRLDTGDWSDLPDRVEALENFGP